MAMSRRSNRVVDSKLDEGEELARTSKSLSCSSKKRRASNDGEKTAVKRTVRAGALDLSKSDAELVREIDSAYEEYDLDQIRAMMQDLKSDEGGVHLPAALQAARSALSILEAERQRLRVMLQYEHKILSDERARLKRQGCTDVEESMKKFAIIGVDEVGVGPLAGPCVGGAVCLWLGATVEDDEKSHFGLATLYGVNDSKKLKPAERDALDQRIRTSARAFAVGTCTSQEVDMLNNRNASMEVMRRSVMTLLRGPLKGFRVHLLVDYHTVPDMPVDQVVGQTCLEKGDAKSQSIGAASIVAKVHRDAYMQQLHKRYPSFGFDKNAGYGTRDHMNALQRGLLCPEHRLSFAPVRAAFERCRDAESDGNLDDEAVEAATMDALSTHYLSLTAMQAAKAEAVKAAKLAKTASKSSNTLKPRYEPNSDGGTDVAPTEPTGLTAWLKKKA